jgi:hypothetical protein
MLLSGGSFPAVSSWRDPLDLARPLPKSVESTLRERDSRLRARQPATLFQNLVNIARSPLPHRFLLQDRTDGLNSL